MVRRGREREAGADPCCSSRRGMRTFVGAFASSPEWIASTIAREYLYRGDMGVSVLGLGRDPIASTIAREYFSGQRWPPAPPSQPVLRSQAVAECSVSFSASIVAYLAGCHTRKGSP